MSAEEADPRTLPDWVTEWRWRDVSAWTENYGLSKGRLEAPWARKAREKGPEMVEDLERWLGEQEAA